MSKRITQTPSKGIEIMATALDRPRSKKKPAKKTPVKKETSSMPAAKATMITQFTKVLKATAEGYVKQFTPPELSAEQKEQVEKYDAVIEAFGADSSYGKRAVKDKAKIGVDTSAYKAEWSYEVADAIAMAANGLGLGFKLTAKAKAARKSSGGTRGATISDSVRDDAKKKILKALKDGPKSKSEIQEATDITDKVYTSAKNALLADGSIGTVGKGRAAKLTLA